MSVRRNLVWTYAGQAYAAVLGMAMLPAYVRLLGAESFGLVGFYSAAQVWSQLVDLGLTPTLSRELSRARAGVVAAEAAAGMVRAAEWFFLAAGVLGIALAAAARHLVADHWLHVQHLPEAQVARCVVWMGAAIGIRWLVTLYRGALAGLEHLVAINVATIVFATLRSAGVVLVLMAAPFGAEGFFAYQAVVAVLELGTTRALFYARFSMREVPWRPGVAAWRSAAKLSGSMTALTTLWIVIAQADRLVLSGAIALEQYGYYTLAVTLASGITLLAMPMSQALQPRFTILTAGGDLGRAEPMYRATTQGVTACTFAAAALMARFS
jgi:O-antigen/teichoic acid export membrane protein